jgi:acyl-CoA thioester hydrolase
MPALPPMKDQIWRHRLSAYARHHDIPTRYGDMDANAHLNNVAITRLVEEARVRFHWSLREAGADPVAVVVAHVAVDFVHEGRYPEPVSAGVAVVSVGQRSYRLAVGLFQDGRTLALADCVMVWRGRGEGGQAMAPGLRAALEALGPGA